MGHESTPAFRSFHALRIRGFATVDGVSEMTALDPDVVEDHLADLGRDGHARFREPQSMWQITAQGREAHLDHLELDLRGAPLDELGGLYTEFFDRNGEFKQICTDWQLRDGEPNDHADAAYDARVIDRLAELHAEAVPIVAGIGEVLLRFGPYAPRLAAALDGVAAGETHRFTGVMCSSYHDVWMELHEDLILTQRIDRAAEGSF